MEKKQEKLDNQSEAKKAIALELDDQQEVDLEVESFFRSTYVVTVGQTQEITTAKKRFFNMMKMREVIVGLLYSLVAAMILIGHAYALNHNMLPSLKLGKEITPFQLAIMNIFQFLFLFYGTFVIIHLRMDKSQPMNTRGLAFHLANTLPLLISATYNIFAKINTADQFHFHVMMGGITILIQALVLGSTMIGFYWYSRKRYPILLKKTLNYWFFSFLIATMPLIFWAITVQTGITKTNGIENVALDFVFLASAVILMASLLVGAIIFSNRFYIFHDKLTSRSPYFYQLIYTSIFTGIVAGVGVGFIHFPIPFKMQSTLYIMIVISLLILAGFVTIATFNYKRPSQDKFKAATGALITNGFMIAQITLAMVVIAFLKRSPEAVRSNAPYIMIIGGVGFLLTNTLARLLEMPRFDLTVIYKIIVIITTTLLSFIFAIAILTVQDALIIIDQYNSQIVLWSSVMAFSGMAIILIYDLFMVVNARVHERQAVVEKAEKLEESAKQLQQQAETSNQ